MRETSNRQLGRLTPGISRKGAPIYIEKMEARMMFSAGPHASWSSISRHHSSSAGNLVSPLTSPPTLLSASSDQVVPDRIHLGSYNTFAINLPLNVPPHVLPGIEDRTDSAGNPIYIALVFDSSIDAANFSVNPLVDTSGVSDGTASAPAVDGSNPNQLDVPVTGWVNAQTMVMTVSYSGAGGPTSYTVKIGFLLGDVLGLGRVNGSDQGNFGINFGFIDNSSNFRCDFNGDGVINGSDFAIFANGFKASLVY
jgi:hypothetical protein